MRGMRGVKRRGKWDVESSHILAGSFCRVSRGINGKYGGGEEARTRRLKERGDGEKRVGQGRVISGADRKGTGKGSREKYR